MVDQHLIQAYLNRNFNEYLDIHKQMVDVNSFTANPQGVNTLGELTARLFARLGFQAEYVQSECQHYGQHLFLFRAGDAQAKARNALALVSHLDTVFPPEEEQENDFSWRVEGDRIYGPGTVDIKGGTVMIYMVLDTIQQFAPQEFQATDWYICLNATEEVLSDEFARLCQERLPGETKACLVFEGGTPSQDNFSLVVARKGRATFDVFAEGRSAHAGNYHHLGANAVVQMAETIRQIAALTDYENQITFNVGKVGGGVVVNRVPHYAEAEVEMRAFSSEMFDQGIASMVAFNNASDISSVDGYSCRVRVKLKERTAPWPANAGTQGLYVIWEKVAEEMGIQVSPEERGGLSDGNLLWNDFPTLDGLGPTGANAHCSERSQDGSKDQEYAERSSFIPKTMLNVVAILELLDGPSMASEQ
jgi:glutamate carboxypeptidase